MKFPVLLF